ncbi:hypothetical protein AVEN_131264-1 [Araneus ventricosus]|uniref:Uncharacterized protein n=1 Tax=Araneus ventricosus TaxID=182803 RepID=A0A4Y2LR71_ARAVE|nr:hypothetical protein AVEN_131264-1 [Araneus ventricosus]
MTLFLGKRIVTIPTDSWIEWTLIKAAKTKVYVQSYLQIFTVGKARPMQSLKVSSSSNQLTALVKFTTEIINKSQYSDQRILVSSLAFFADQILTCVQQRISRLPLLDDFTPERGKAMSHMSSFQNSLLDDVQ